MRQVKVEKISDKKDKQLVLCPLNPGQYCVSDCAWFGIKHLFLKSHDNYVACITCRNVIIGELVE